VGSTPLLEFAAGERVIAQGEPGSALYAIAGGTARVAVRTDGAAEHDVATLRAGDVFGEMSLLTGDPRTASVYSLGDLAVAEVSKESLAPLLAANGALAGRIAELMVLRREGLDQARAAAALDATRRQEIQAAAQTLLKRICAFFSLRG
jgi:CRP-like cAMP-binding protein